MVLAATAGTPRHALVVDEQMRSLFAYMRTMTVPTSVFAATEDWNSKELGERITRAAIEVLLLMESGFAAKVRSEAWQSYQHEYGSAGGTELEHRPEHRPDAPGDRRLGGAPAASSSPQAKGPRSDRSAAPSRTAPPGRPPVPWSEDGSTPWRRPMGDGGDGGAEGMDALAEMPVDFGTETVQEVSGDPADDFGDLILLGGGIDGGAIAPEWNEDEVIALTWTAPDTTSGS